MKNLILCLLLAASGCATKKSISEILISKSGADFYGKTYTSRADLTTALISKQVATVHLVLGDGVPYNQVEMTVGAVQDAGAVLDVRLIGSCKGC